MTDPAVHVSHRQRIVRAIVRGIVLGVLTLGIMALCTVKWF